MKRIEYWQERIERFRFHTDKKLSLYADILVRYLACRALSLLNQELLFSANAYGKPFLLRYPNFQYNLSHTRNAIVVGISEKEVGVDVEKIGVSRLDLAKRFFTVAETEYIQSGRDKERRFYEIWTKKEAYIKWIGTGLSLPLQAFSVLDSDANILSFLLLQEESYPWILNNFIQLTSLDHKFLGYADFFYRNCPLVEYQRIKIEVLTKERKEIISFIQNAICNGYYIYLVVNIKHIHAYHSNYDVPHDLFIYGYDEEKQIFYISDNFQNGMYSNAVCTYGEMINALNYEKKSDFYWYWGFRDCAELLSFNSEQRAVFEVYRVKESIKDYLLSRPTKNWYTSYDMWTKELTSVKTYGVTCYETIKNHVKFAYETTTFTSGWRQAFHLMWEHKKIMLLRLDYMLKNNYISHLEGFSENYKEIEQRTGIALKLALKYNQKNDLRILERILNHYEWIEENEKIILEQLYNSLII